MWTPEMRRRYSWTRRKEGLRLTDQEWAVIEPLLPQHDKMGCPWKHGLRTIVDAIVHLLRTGCAWSALPDWAPPRSTGLRVVPPSGRWRMAGHDPPCPAHGGARVSGARGQPNPRHHQQPDGQGHGSGWGARL